MNTVTYQQKEPGSLRAYAKHSGCAPSAVHKAIEVGRIFKSVTWLSDRWQIDFAAADKEWAENTAPRLDPDERPHSGGMSFREVRRMRKFFLEKLREL